MNWVEDESNGLHQQLAVGDIIYDVQYKPMDYLTILQDPNNNWTHQQKEDFRASKQDLEYFTLKIKTADGLTDPLQYKATDPNDYYHRLKYFSFDIQHDLHLVANGDTLPCRLSHFERTNGLAPYKTIVLGFEKSAAPPAASNSGDLLLVFKDRVFQPWSEPIAIEIKANDLNQIPDITN